MCIFGTISDRISDKELQDLLGKGLNPGDQIAICDEDITNHEDGTKTIKVKKLGSPEKNLAMNGVPIDIGLISFPNTLVGRSYFN